MFNTHCSERRYEVDELLGFGGKFRATASPLRTLFFSLLEESLPSTRMFAEMVLASMSFIMGLSSSAVGHSPTVIPRVSPSSGSSLTGKLFGYFSKMSGAVSPAFLARRTKRLAGRAVDGSIGYLSNSSLMDASVSLVK